VLIKDPLRLTFVTTCHQKLVPEIANDVQNGHIRNPKRPQTKTATNQNGHMTMVIGEHVNKYLSLNKLGIIKSRTETMPEVD